MTELARSLRSGLSETPARPAAVGPSGARLSRAELLAGAERVAAGLGRAGVGPAVPVVVAVAGEQADLAALIGVWLAGAVAVPVHRSTPRSVRLGLETGLGRCYALDRAAWVAADRGDRASELEGASTIVFTSGSTGMPKGVVLRADRQAGKLDMIREQTAWTDGASTLLGLQLTFSFGQWVSLLTLISGGTLILPDRPSADIIGCILRARRVDRLATVPTVLRRLVVASDAAGPAGPARILSGGEVLPASLGQRLRAVWPGTAIGDIYGLTETGTCDFFVDPADYDAAAGSIGRPGRGIKARIAEDGELRLRSPWGMIGYLGAPGATAEAFDDAGYFRTGDLATVDAAGRWRLLGRRKELINRGGLKVSPIEIEAILDTHPEVDASLVSGVTAEDGGEDVVAAVVPAGRHAADLRVEDLRAWLSERIERYKIPSRIAVLEALPTGATGKADRRALARMMGGA